MTRQQRADRIRQDLEQRFPETPIPLAHRDAYTLLIAVLLSAQCTDKRVNEVTPILFNRADDPVSMARLSVAEVEAIVRPCGLGPRKAAAIVALSQALLALHDGQVPRDQAALEALPGVGRKTALVVRSQAFGEPAFPVDTHIHRLAQRWGLTNGQNVRQTETDLCKLFPQESWNQLHLRIIFYGREVCPARGCDGLRCPLCQACFPLRRKVPELRKP